MLSHAADALPQLLQEDVPQYSIYRPFFTGDRQTLSRYLWQLGMLCYSGFTVTAEHGISAKRNTNEVLQLSCS